MVKIKIWYMAHIQDYPFFRVTYQDGQKTHPLFYSEANGLCKCFNGKLSIDYDYGKYFLKELKTPK